VRRPRAGRGARCPGAGSRAGARSGASSAPRAGPHEGSLMAVTKSRFLTLKAKKEGSLPQRLQGKDSRKFG
jgi:hypothetical protein